MAMQMTGSVQLVVFELDDRAYAFFLRSVQYVVRAVEITPLPGAPALVMGIIDLHGTVVSMFDLRRRVGAPARPAGLEDHFVIVRVGKRLVGMVVDRVRQVTEVREDLLVRASSIWPGWKGIEGVVRLEDGLILIQEMERFLSIEEEQILDEAFEARSQHGS